MEICYWKKYKHIVIAKFLDTPFKIVVDVLGKFWARSQFLKVYRVVIPVSLFLNFVLQRKVSNDNRWRAPFKSLPLPRINLPIYYS